MLSTASRWSWSQQLLSCCVLRSHSRGGKGPSAYASPAMPSLADCLSYVRLRTLFLAFDKAFALLEAFAIVYVARPAAIASARTLLQAAPSSSRAFESTFTLPGVSFF